MEANGTPELGFLASLPDAGKFLGIVGPVLVVFAGALFCGRHTLGVRFLRRAGDGILRVGVTVLLLAMVLLSSLQIVLRNFFDSGLLWIDPLLRHLVLVLAFAGALLATGAKRHIQINVLGRLLSGWPNRIVGAVIAVAAGSICLTLVHGGLRFLRDEIEFGGTVFLALPSWVVVGILPAAFLALAFRFYYLAYAEAAGEAPQPAEAVRGDEDGSEDAARPRDAEDAP